MKRMRRKLISVFIILILVLGIGCYFQERTGTEVSVVERKEGYILPIYCVQTEEPWVSLTFDSAWGTEDLDDILNILKDNEVPACFFVTGEWVDTYPGAVKKIVSAGHEIGSHGDKHKHMSALSVEENRQELEQCNRKIENVTGSRTKLFRAPYGDYDEELIKTVTAEGYYTIQWDVDSLDWKDYGVDAIIKRVSENQALGNGSIILMHNGTKYTKDALDRLLKEVKKKGYRFVPVSRLIYQKNYYIDHTGRQIQKAKR